MRSIVVISEYKSAKGAAKRGVYPACNSRRAGGRALEDSATQRVLPKFLVQQGRSNAPLSKLALPPLGSSPRTVTRMSGAGIGESRICATTCVMPEENLVEQPSRRQIGGQNAKFKDPKLLARICLHARRGRSKTDCFKLVGVSPDGGFTWLKRGREQDPVCDGILIRFERVFERCVAKFNAEQLAMIEGAAQSGAPNTWQAAGWLLERRDPGNFGRRDAVKVEGSLNSGPQVQLNQVVLIDGDAREASRALLRRISSFGPDEPLGIGVGGEPEEDAAVRDEPIDVDPRPAR